MHTREGLAACGPSRYCVELSWRQYEHTGWQMDQPVATGYLRQHEQCAALVRVATVARNEMVQQR